MDFFIAVPSESGGKRIALDVAPLGFEVSVEMDNDTQEWTCYCTKTIIPRLADVVAIERQLDIVASRFGGWSDGFGTFGNKEVT
jgi:hypothetical protein